MAGSDDEFSAFDFSEFTEDDFKQIDADLAPKGSPSIVVEVEAPQGRPKSVLKYVTNRKEPTETSPYRQHRHGGVLSVSDLASLAWCEVQFDYGLRQRRSRPLATRPPSFISAQGKEIFVQKSVAVRNDHTTKQGKAIHKELEREVRFEELKVDITSNEERWALRLVNMLASFKCVIQDGLIREMPVFGFIQNQVVVGIIDELVRIRQPLPQSKRSAPCHEGPDFKRARKAPFSSQQPITDFLPSVHNEWPVEQDSACEECSSTPPSNTLSASPQDPPYVLQIRDTKTRQRRYLPLDEDTLPSQIQLMLYHRLLKDLVSHSAAFDFDYLWKHMKLKSSQVFSTRFLVQAGLITESDSFQMVCLDDLAKAWTHMVQQLGNCKVDTNLEIIYRLRPVNSKMKRKDKGKAKIQDPVQFTQEDQDLARAIEASLYDQRCSAIQNHGLGDASTGINQDGTSSYVEDRPREDLQPSSGPVPQLGLPKNEDYTRLLNIPKDDGNSTSDEDSTPADAPIIGSKMFTYDDTILNEYVARALEWWYGHRRPRGVSLVESRRCFSCEYESSCEWREQKASERQLGQVRG